jgi:hypothetical protein
MDMPMRKVDGAWPQLTRLVGGVALHLGSKNDKVPQSQSDKV